MAGRWVQQGAGWLHVVNLDGAFDEGGTANWHALPDLVSSGAQVQFGGGLRTLKDVERAFQIGVARIILGTTAVEEPELITDLVSVLDQIEWSWVLTHETARYVCTAGRAIRL